MTAKEIIKLAVFEGKQIRKTIHNDEWWFAIVDVIEVLAGSPTPRQYWGKIKKREFTNLQLSPVWVQLKMEAADGKKYARLGGNVAGTARKATEKELGRSIVSPENYLPKSLTPPKGKKK